MLRGQLSIKAFVEVAMIASPIASRLTMLLKKLPRLIFTVSFADGDSICKRLYELDCCHANMSSLHWHRDAASERGVANHSS